MEPLVDVAEQRRLNEARVAHIPWKKWGPYLSERQWGTVREDYSDNGDAGNYFIHDQARSRACCGTRSTIASTWSSGCASIRAILCLNPSATRCATPNGSTYSTPT
jgi:hypothetical protein